MKIKQTTISIPENYLISLKKYSGELISKTGQNHCISDLILTAIIEKYPFIIENNNEKKE